MNDIPKIITNITSLLWPVVTGLTVVMLIYAGILFITSSGDPAKITKAKAAVIWAVIGFIVAILAYSLPAIINTALTK